MPTPKRKKHKYEVLATSIGLHRIFVEGHSPDEALKALQRKIAGESVTSAGVKSRRYSETWSDPSEQGEAWLVAPAETSQQNTQKLMIWDGKAARPCNSEELYAHFVQSKAAK